MKYRVRIDHQTFEVEIKDIHARPVIAFVDGEPVEVWPEGESPLAAVHATPPQTAVQAAPQAAPRASGAIGSQNGSGSGSDSPNGKATLAGAGSAGKNVLGVVRAPIPGVVTAVQVRPGDEVQAGQQLLVLEAMKMNNSIRSTRSGRIAEVHVQVGQQVKHSQPLVEFEQP